MPEPITDDELRVLEALANEHVVGQALPITPTPQGMAVAQLVRSVPWLLHEIERLADLASERRSEIVRISKERDEWEANAEDNEARAEKAEAAVERVRRLASLALYKGPEPADTHAVVLDSLAKELLAALDGE